MEIPDAWIQIYYTYTDHFTLIILNCVFYIGTTRIYIKKIIIGQNKNYLFFLYLVSINNNILCSSTVILYRHNK